LILFSFIHITDTERKIKRKVREAVTRNTQFTGAVVTLELRTVQQLQWQKIYKIFLKQS